MELQDIAKAIKDTKEQIFLLYAFNATGKTRLSVEYKELCRNEEHKQTGVYYNAFSEDLFVWNNDIENAEENIRMRIVKSSLNDLHSYIDETKVREKLKPYNVKYDFDFHTNEEHPEDGIEEIIFYLKDAEDKNPIKISRGEERIFIWCFFLALFDTEGWQDEQNEYIFVDDPVSSLDDHNIFVTIFTLLELIDKYCDKKKIIITTHHIGFATILSDCLFKGEKSDRYKKKSKIQLLERTDDGYVLANPKNDVLLYHLRLLQILDDAVVKDELEIYHIALLRQVLENIASFLGTGQLKYVIKQIGITNTDRVSTIVNALTHQKVYYPQMEAMVDDNKQIVREVYHTLMSKYRFIIHSNN
ncbi:MULTISPECIES: AAA family ATPase [Butyricimonas]|uniref:AAA family ATPase n=1 Tax=Butyricimonas TaxID=574697 RepID=UPI0022E30BD6|nr:MULTISPECIES: AAA family ATPase [Butyricimonas]